MLQSRYKLHNYLNKQYKVYYMLFGIFFSFLFFFEEFVAKSNTLFLTHHIFSFKNSWLVKKSSIFNIYYWL